VEFPRYLISGTRPDSTAGLNPNGTRALATLRNG